MTASIPEPARAALDFWFGPAGSAVHGNARKAWFAKDEAFDAVIRGRFGATIEQSLRGELDAWSGNSRAALAQIIVLDQFTRNAFRDSARAFAGDARALAAASAMVGARRDEELPRAEPERKWVYPRVALSEEDKLLWFWGTQAALPLLFAYLGLIVLMVRRLR